MRISQSRHYCYFGRGVAGEVFFVVRGCPVHCGMLSSIPNFYPQNIHSTPPIQIMTPCQGEAKLSTVENHCPRSMNIIPEKHNVTEVSITNISINNYNYSYHLLSVYLMLRPIKYLQKVYEKDTIISPFFQKRKQILVSVVICTWSSLPINRAAEI